MILVTGATGRVGYHLMELLADAGAEATAMVRVEARGTDLPGTAGHVVASLEDPPPASVLREFDRDFAHFSDTLGASFARYGFAVISDHGIAQARIDGGASR